MTDAFILDGRLYVDDGKRLECGCTVALMIFDKPVVLSDGKKADSAVYCKHRITYFVYVAEKETIVIVDPPSSNEDMIP